MATRKPLPLQATPYSWDDTSTPPPETLQLWTEVGNGIDKNQTVVWKNAVESLDQGNKYLRKFEDARIFVEKYMGPIIGILVEQQPQKIGPHERNCVQESLALAVTIVSQDLDIQIQRKGECCVLDVLSLVFNKKKAYYKGNKGNWNVNHLVGLPEVRLKMIDRFRAESGFAYLDRYLLERINTPLFPRLDSLHQILQAIGDAIPSRSPGGDHAASARQMEDDAIAVAKAVMEFIKEANDEALKKLPTDQLSQIQHDLQRIFDRLISSRRLSTYDFYAFWRGLILKLITSQSLPLKLFGWEQMNEIIDASSDHGPPPKAFIVSGGGCTFVNGSYVFAGETTEDGYLQRGADISYERRIEAEEEGAGKKLTLFRCTMRSQQKWWFLSEADEEQPGTDRDIDYYQHKSKEHEETEPPASGWSTCRNAGIDPPPTLKSEGLLVPAGEELNTLEHQLARWALDNEIIEQVLGDSVHREVVARSTALIKFLASMCEKYSVPVVDGSGTNKCCLRTSHLLLAWKTCTRKADAAVSAQVYQLLVSILPSCPNSLAIPLLQAVHASLLQSDEKRDYLLEVAEFCSALAAANSVDAKPAPNTQLSESVREEVLKLLWAVLTHPDASTLKSYESLKRYVTNELRVEPKGSQHRETFLKSCINDLSASESQREGTSVDEVQALRMVKLTRFVLEACPRDQAHRFVMDNNGALPILLFNELRAHLERRKSGGTFLKRIPSRNEMEFKQHPIMALQERLRILRYVYGLSDQIHLKNEFLHCLWNLCVLPADREELMVFIASASSSGLTTNIGNLMVNELSMPAQNNATVPADELLSAAFSEEVCNNVFLDLFCSPDLSYEDLGAGAYRSFQFMFEKFRTSPGSSHASGVVALDALWRICLTSGNGAVASQAMKDLLNVYAYIGAADQATENAWTKKSESTDAMVTETNHRSFGDRVFDCLSTVKKELDEGQAGAERSAERCLRILNAAIGQNASGGNSMTFSTLTRLSSLSLDSTLTDINKFLPHGMRGQACYRRIGIMAKRTWLHNQSGQVSHVYATREDAPLPGPQANPSKTSPTLRFSLDVHPLETLASVKIKVAGICHCPVGSVKPVSVSGRLVGSSNRSPGGDSQMNLNVVADDSVIDELGIVQGSELVFQIVNRELLSQPGNANAKGPKYNRARDLSDIFFDDDGRFADKLFVTLLGVLKKLPWREPDVVMTEEASADVDTHKLVWDFLLAMPTDISVAARVRSTSSQTDNGSSIVSDDDAMEVDASKELWPSLLDLKSFHRSVYVMLAIDAFLQPAVEVLSVLPNEQRLILERSMQEDAMAFRHDFIESGGFDAVVRFFSESDTESTLMQRKTRMGNAVALRILKCCLFGNSRPVRVSQDSTSSLTTPDEVGVRLLQSLSDAEGLLRSLTAMVVGDVGISTSTISDVLKFLRLLFRSSRTAQSFVSLPNGTAEQFLITLLMWEGGPEATRTSAGVGAAAKIRKNTHDLILQTPLLADHALPWLIRAIDRIEVTSDCTAEYFDVLQKLVSDDRSTARSRNASGSELRDLGATVCKKIASCPRPTNETALIDFSTGVLCGCLALLRALIETGGGNVLRDGTNILVNELSVTRWSEMIDSPNRGGVLGAITSSFRSGQRVEDAPLIDLMGAIFDGFLSPGGSSSVVAICCDKESRQRGFDVVGAAARSCRGGDGYMALVTRVNGLVSSASPYVRHRWGQVGAVVEGHSRTARNSSKYSGLRNQGCTCYMNSVLQQLFMMPELRKIMCAAPLPASLRSTGGVISAKGAELVGKKLSMQWESGVSYDAMVEAFDDESGMHTIRYCPMQVATVGGTGHDQVQPDDIARLPPPLPDEFFLSEGRPGKETGVFEIVSNALVNAGESTSEIRTTGSQGGDEIQETEDQISSRHLLEEVQRTFIHLEEGSRGRCFDPRALVEACACLKLEFDVWQQNDASEFATKLLDRLEISLKRWAPSHFRYLDHTFGLKQTKQKICKECGLKTNREEKLMNIDCQIRGKADVHEALAGMTEVELMEGNNKVFCDRCKKNTDTILRTAISMLPNMLILSLKRFDLDYNTFETVKLNSRCAFGQTLNMKRYTLEGLEAMEQQGYSGEGGGPSPMDTTGEISGQDPLSKLPDDDYEYKLAGVLVHAGVAQGGHYYSFIKDRNPGSDEQWFRFDDEDVTAFDPASIEVECFGGKVKKETKWPNGQVHTVESEQYANALMLFYEKVKPSDVPKESKDQNTESKKQPKPVETSSGYDVFEPDVRRSNATHRWQTFLFDTEFQIFLKGLLGLCRLERGDRSDAGEPWRANVVQMLLGFVFDILLYSSERPSLNDWVRMFEETFSVDRYSARAFVQKLARKTLAVSDNWARTYLSDCPDQLGRTAAVRIFSAAVRSCASSEEEQRALGNWTQAWKEQLAAFTPTVPSALPCGLEGKWKSLEDAQSIGGGGASSIGIIVSFLNTLLESTPRTWRSYSPELSLFIRNLANMSSESGGHVVRAAMIEAMIPARLMALVIRERAPALMRAAFPGASVAMEVAETQMRAESNPVAHVMPLSGNHVMNPTDINARGNGGAPVAADFLTLFEALGCMAALRGVTHAILILDTDETARGRHRSTLSKAAVNALTQVFRESCAPSSLGMGQREIEIYLQRCGIDSGTVPPQKIVDIMAKYPTTTGGNGSKSTSYLSLEGFLAYYRDTAQTHEQRVRADLHTFGFRPDLTRRSFESRTLVMDEKEQPRYCAESVALDVASQVESQGEIFLGPMAEYGLDSFNLFAVAWSASEPLCEMLLSGTAIGRKCDNLIFATLKAIYQAPSGWDGSHSLTSAVTILRVLASIPDDKQNHRIAMIMQCNDKPAHNVEHGAGLLSAARAFFGSRPTQHYSSEIHYAYDRYVGILKELLLFHSIFGWMSENRAKWSWMERDLLDSHPPVPQQNQMRGNYSATRDVESSAVPLDHHQHSDSDMAGMNDSEEDDDDDSRFEEMETFQDLPNQLYVEGGGQGAVNGVYTRDGYFESACKYSMQSKYKDESCTFSLFQCNVSNNTKHWYISIVPRGSQPGTSTDIDFYSAPVTESCTDFPPMTGWTKSNEGLDPAPKIYKEHRGTEIEPNGNVGQMWNEGEEDENHGGQTYI